MRYCDTAIFSDLDGTLFNSNSEISAENIAAIRAYTGAGGLFAIATGRSYPNALQYMAPVVPNAPSVVFNGAGVYDPISRQYPYQVTLDRDAILDLLRWCRGHLPGMDIQVYGEQMTYYVTPRETAEEALIEQLRPCEFTTVEAVADLPLLKSLLYGIPAETAELDRYLADSGLADRFEIVRAITGIPPYYEHIELLPKAANKGAALDACRSIPCFQGRTLLAIGDYKNDLELLSHADVAFCPSNACDEAKALARQVLVSNDESVIADLIERVIPALD